MHTVQRLVESSEFFSVEETDVAVELVRERLRKGPASGYEFLFAEYDGHTVAYTCFGPIACTRSSYDLYWIVVHKQVRGPGIGRALLRRTEEAITAQGGQRLYVETSSRTQYASTGAFYRACDYREEALLEDFYAPGDGKQIYCKVLAEHV